MAVSGAAQTTDVANVIVSLAGAARKAQEIMDSSEKPMIIREYRFKYNIGGDFNFSSETGVEASFWGVSISQKLTYGFSESWGLEIECKIIPIVLLNGGGSA